MPADRAVIALHGTAIAVALAAALAWPRAGQAALMVPLGRPGLPAVLAWAEAEDAALLRLDSAGGTVIARIPSNNSLWGALRLGIMPISARAPGCTPSLAGGSVPWTS